MKPLSGDPTGHTPLYLLKDGSHDTSLSALQAAHPDFFTRESISPFALAHVLQSGFVPLPYSVFEDIHILEAGDRFIPPDVFTFENPFLNSLSREDQTPDPDKLLAVLVESLNSLPRPKGQAYLMLSSGKDSAALALALAHSTLREKTICLTFANDRPGEEDVVARQMCKKLGLPHKTVKLDLTLPELPEKLTAALAKLTLPTLDLVSIPYLACVLDWLGPDDLLLDGSGSDLFVGHIPPRWQVTWDPRIKRWQPLTQIFRPLFNPRWKPAKLLRTRAEFCFAGKYLHPRESRRLRGDLPNATAFWEAESRRYSHLDLIDFRDTLRGRHPDQELFMRKARAAAEAVGAQVAFPWCHTAVTDYYFNLPEASRFTRGAYVNKILVRQMLKDKLDYDAAKIGKRGFEFEAAAFYKRYRDWVQQEVTRTTVWEGKAAAALLVLLCYLQKIFKCLNFMIINKNTHKQ